MAEIVLDDQVLCNLKDKVVIVTGSAQGIGSATVEQCLHAGAHVVAADFNDIKGRLAVESIKKDKTSPQGDVTYVHVDVANYDSVLSLFKHTLSIHGRVDMVAHCAAVGETTADWFVPGLNMQAIEKPPPTTVFDINLLGTFYVTQVALTAMEQARAPGGKDDKSITLISSVAGFKDSPGLFAYSASKHGVIGLMRSLRGYLPSTFNVRMNVVCPWATDTEMFSNVRDVWVENSLPLNSPGEVASVILQCAASENIHGMAVYVAGGKGFDIEEGINRLEPEWMGQKQASDLAKGQAVLSTGASWTAKRSLE